MKGFLLGAAVLISLAFLMTIGYFVANEPLFSPSFGSSIVIGGIDGIGPSNSCLFQPDGRDCIFDVVREQGILLSPGSGVGECNKRRCRSGGNDNSCPEGRFACPSNPSEGNTVACCKTGEQTCHSYGSNAWCSPVNSDSCPEGRPLFCQGSDGDHACCRTDESCDTFFGSAVCKVTEDSCTARGGSYCGRYACCSPNQVCNDDHNLHFCSVNPNNPWPSGGCPEGQELCRGASEWANVCCNAGQCMPSQRGSASCRDGRINP